MKATYHQEAPNKPLVLTVIKENSDGTVDLGHGDEKNFTLVVGSCPLSEVPKPGHAVLLDGKAPKEVDAKPGDGDAGDADPKKKEADPNTPKKKGK